MAVDGRSASGKSTLATLLRSAVPGCALLHTDDVAWNESFLAWAHLMAQHVLLPLRRGDSVSYRPSAWERNARDGQISVPAATRVVVVEGVGSSQRALAPLLDVVIWVQSDFDLAEARGIARDVESGANGDEDESVAFWRTWMAEELAFLERDRPWQRADLVVAGSPVAGLRSGQLAVASGPLIGAGSQ